MSSNASSSNETLLTKNSSAPIALSLFVTGFIWVICSLLGISYATLQIDSLMTAESFVPFGNDAFYHARRILDTAFSDRGFYQFDDTIHAPEGSWLSWPWAYDYLLGQLLAGVNWLDNDIDPMMVLVYVPVAFLPVSVALTIGICRRVGLPVEYCGLAALGLVLLPLTQMLHGVGHIDHHYVELIFVLLTCWSTLRWLEKSASRSAAIACAVALTAAQAFHHGLFILQLPVLVSLFLLWVRQSMPAAHNLRVFSGVLLGMTFLIAIPSGPFRDMQFNMSTLSWFHVYIAFCVAVLVVYLSMYSFSMRRLSGLCVIALLLMLPPAGELLLGSRFITGDLLLLDQIIEMQSPYAMITGEWGLEKVVGLYSWLIITVPLLILLAGFYLFAEARAVHIAYCAFALMGLLLLSTQNRLSYFGLVFLLSGWMYFLLKIPALSKRVYGHAEKDCPAQVGENEGLLAAGGNGRGIVLVAALLISVVALRPPLSGTLYAKYPLGGDHLYEMARPMLLQLGEHCAEQPGIVLAPAQFGHYIRYHTECSVIANNFLLTPQHSAKVQVVDQLMSHSLADIARDVPEVRYIFVFSNDTHEMIDGQTRIKDLSNLQERNPPLVNELLFEPNSRSAAVETIGEFSMPFELDGKIKKTKIAGVYKL